MANLQFALDDCLKALARGESRAECLKRYPENAAELAALLDTAARVKAARGIQAPSDIRLRVAQRVQAHARAKPRSRQRSSWFSLAARPAFALGLALALILTLTTASAQAALPGDLLYPVKLASEQVWRAFQPDVVEADLNRAERRVREIEQVAPNHARVERAEHAYVSVVESVMEHLAAAEERAEGREKQAAAAERARIEQALRAHRGRLRQAGVVLPELERIVGPDRGPAPASPPVPSENPAESQSAQARERPPHRPRAGPPGHKPKKTSP